MENYHLLVVFIALKKFEEGLFQLSFWNEKVESSIKWVLENMAPGPGLEHIDMFFFTF